MSKTAIPPTVKMILIGKSAGKCEFRGCNKRIIEEGLTKLSGNYSNFAHIIADSPDGPRGDIQKSALLAKDESNIMVMCREHHKLIDDNPNTFTIEALHEMKEEHETYISKLLTIELKSKVHVVTYNSNISNRSSLISKEQIDESIFEQRVWADRYINMNGNNYDESEKESFYELESQNICQIYNEQIKPLLLDKEEHRRILLYAIAPQPLLIYLGSLFSDIAYVEAQQLQREPQKWIWSSADNHDFKLNVIRPLKKNKIIALNLSISADIEESRITATLGEEVDIWKIESTKKSTDIIKSKNQVQEYKKTIRKVFEEIKDTYRM